MVRTVSVRWLTPVGSTPAATRCSKYSTQSWKLRARGAVRRTTALWVERGLVGDSWGLVGINARGSRALRMMMVRPSNGAAGRAARPATYATVSPV